MIPIKQPAYDKKNKKVIFILIIVIIAMFFFGYAMVPLYNVLCNKLGINGKTGGATTISSTIDTSRWITIEFLANNNAGLPWKFYPMVTKIKIHPGENKIVTYFAKNDSNKTMTVQAIPSFTPSEAAKYMKKTECFCFRQQTLKSQQSMVWPVIFHIDEAIPKYIHTVTLSYTLFDLSGLRINQNQNEGKLVP